MKPIDLEATRNYVNTEVGIFHGRRLRSLETLKLENLLKKNPYLFKAKNVETASEIVDGLLVAFLSSSEEQLFGSFLENLAIFVAAQTSGGHKSAAEGADLEFFNKGVHYVVAVKSGPNWGNSQQQNQLQQNLQNAVKRVMQSGRATNVQPVLGICYGKTRTNRLRGYLKVVGQNFWCLISENKDLYIDIIEPIGYKAKEHNDAYRVEKNKMVNRLTSVFLSEFCEKSGSINWDKLVRHACGNYDLDTFDEGIYTP